MQPVVIHLEREFAELRRDVLVEPLMRNLGWESERLAEDTGVRLMLLHLERETDELDADVKALEVQLKEELEEMKASEAQEMQQGEVEKDLPVLGPMEIKTTKMGKTKKQMRIKIPWR